MQLAWDYRESFLLVVSLAGCKTHSVATDYLDLLRIKKFYEPF